jgi:hypothetical protein
MVIIQHATSQYWHLWLFPVNDDGANKVTIDGAARYALFKTIAGGFLSTNLSLGLGD